MKIVLPGVLGVYNQGNTKLVNQIFKLLLHEAHNHIDFPNAHFLQLQNHALNQPLAVDLQQRFGGFQIDGNHAHAKSRRQNHRILRTAPAK